MISEGGFIKIFTLAQLFCAFPKKELQEVGFGRLTVEGAVQWKKKEVCYMTIGQTIVLLSSTFLYEFPEK